MSILKTLRDYRIFSYSYLALYPNKSETKLEYLYYLLNKGKVNIFKYFFLTFFQYINILESLDPNKEMIDNNSSASEFNNSVVKYKTGQLKNGNTM